jgi:hypothetical protein
MFVVSNILVIGKKLRQMNIHKRYKWQAIFLCKTSKIFYKIKYQLDEMIQQICLSG